MRLTPLLLQPLFPLLRETVKLLPLLIILVQTLLLNALLLPFLFLSPLLRHSLLLLLLTLTLLFLLLSLTLLLLLTLTLLFLLLNLTLLLLLISLHLLLLPINSLLPLLLINLTLLLLPVILLLLFLSLLLLLLFILLLLGLFLLTILFLRAGWPACPQQQHCPSNERYDQAFKEIKSHRDLLLVCITSPQRMRRRLADSEACFQPVRMRMPPGPFTEPGRRLDSLQSKHAPMFIVPGLHSGRTPNERLSTDLGFPQW